METVAETFARIVALNDRMQEFFREWDAVVPGVDEARFVDHRGNIRLITAFEEVLFDKLQPDARRHRLTDNTGSIEDAVRVIMASVAGRIGHHVDPSDIEPLTFALGDEPAGPAVPAVRREDSVGQVAEMLSGPWHAPTVVAN